MAYVNETGLPSVTDIIKPYIETRWFTTEACERGDAVHNSAKLHMQGKYVPPIGNGWQGYVDSLRRWVDDMVDSVVMVEERLIDKQYGYCGQPDLYAHLNGIKGLIQVDWKTSLQAYPWWELQSCGYVHLGQVNGYEIKQGMSVRLKPDGTGAIVNKYKDTNKYVFFGLINGYRFFNQ